jgi:cell wall-associated NlpC family hydrolase
VNGQHVRRVDEATLSEIQAVERVARKEGIEQVIESAMQYIGTPYVWGGGTRQGIDCSGLVRGAFKPAGVVMPRDADQQFLVGRLVATRWYRLGLRRGDTLFFLGRRGTISHTGIYLGDGKYIEATEPVVKISSFNPDDDNYVEKRDKSFCFAKRVIE